jgi:hypothetical protein
MFFAASEGTKPRHFDLSPAPGQVGPGCRLWEYKVALFHNVQAADGCLFRLSRFRGLMSYFVFSLECILETLVISASLTCAVRYGGGI